MQRQVTTPIPLEEVCKEERVAVPDASFQVESLELVNAVSEELVKLRLCN